MLRKPVATDRISFAGKARMTAQSENALAALESLRPVPSRSCRLPEEYAPLFPPDRIRDPPRAGPGRERWSWPADINAGAASWRRRHLPARFLRTGTPGEDFATPALDRQASCRPGRLLPHPGPDPDGAPDPNGPGTGSHGPADRKLRDKLAGPDLRPGGGGVLCARTTSFS